MIGDLRIKINIVKDTLERQRKGSETLAQIQINITKLLGECLLNIELLQEAIDNGNVSAAAAQHALMSIEAMGNNMAKILEVLGSDSTVTETLALLIEPTKEDATQKLVKKFQENGKSHTGNGHTETVTAGKYPTFHTMIQKLGTEKNGILHRVLDGMQVAFPNQDLYDLKPVSGTLQVHIQVSQNDEVYAGDFGSLLESLEKLFGYGPSGRHMEMLSRILHDTGYTFDEEEQGENAGTNANIAEETENNTFEAMIQDLAETGGGQFSLLVAAVQKALPDQDLGQLHLDDSILQTIVHIEHKDWEFDITLAQLLKGDDAHDGEVSEYQELLRSLLRAGAYSFASNEKAAAPNPTQKTETVEKSVEPDKEYKILTVFEEYFKDPVQKKALLKTIRTTIEKVINKKLEDIKSIDLSKEIKFTFGEKSYKNAIHAVLKAVSNMLGQKYSVAQGKKALLEVTKLEVIASLEADTEAAPSTITPISKLPNDIKALIYNDGKSDPIFFHSLVSQLHLAFGTENLEEVIWSRAENKDREITIMYHGVSYKNKVINLLNSICTVFFKDTKVAEYNNPRKMLDFIQKKMADHPLVSGKVTQGASIVTPEKAAPHEDTNTAASEEVIVPEETVNPKKVVKRMSEFASYVKGHEGAILYQQIRNAIETACKKSLTDIKVDSKQAITFTFQDITFNGTVQAVFSGVCKIVHDTYNPIDIEEIKQRILKKTEAQVNLHEVISAKSQVDNKQLKLESLQEVCRSLTKRNDFKQKLTGSMKSVLVGKTSLDSVLKHTGEVAVWALDGAPKYKFHELYADLGKVLFGSQAAVEEVHDILFPVHDAKTGTIAGLIAHYIDPFMENHKKSLSALLQKIQRTKTSVDGSCSLIRAYIYDVYDPCIGQLATFHKHHFAGLASHTQQHLFWVLIGGVMNVLAEDLEQLHTVWPSGDLVVKTEDIKAAIRKVKLYTDTVNANTLTQLFKHQAMKTMSDDIIQHLKVAQRKRNLYT